MKTTNEYKQKSLVYKIVVMTCLAAIFGLTGCEQQGSAENAEKKIDRAAENAEQKINQAKDEAEKKIEAAKDSVTNKSEATGEYADDSAITAKVKAAILNDPLLNTSHIQVTTNKGVVILDGTVDSESNMARAVELANSQRGVKSVENKLAVNIVRDRI